MTRIDGGYSQLLDRVISLVERAGELIIREWQRDGGPRGAGSKADVDTEIEWLLREELDGLLAVDFWGEETGQYLTGNPFCWVVDPHDGTSDFLKGLPGSSISVALLDKHVPVLGVVYAPVSPDRGKDCIAWAEGLPHLLRNGATLTVDLSAMHLDKDSIVWLSAAASNKPQINIELCHPARFIAMPSIAYRLARAATGDGICAVSLVGLSAHDVAAGHALLRGAGGVLVNQSGQPLNYRQDMDLISLHLFGGAPQACAELAKRPWKQALQARESTDRSSQSAQHPHPPGLQNRAAGCLVGLIAGDNLGAQVEFMDAFEIANRSKTHPLRLEAGGVWNILAGQPTDDGELALTLARGLVEQGDFKSKLIATAYIDWMRSAPFDLGNTTRQALNGPSRWPDSPADEACRLAASQSSQANGALMRVAPIGIACFNDRTKAARWARLDASLTHANEVCQEANASFAVAVAAAVSGDSRRDVITAALASLQRDASGRLTTAAAAIEKCILAAVDGVLPSDYQRHMGWVLIALQSAFFHLAAGHSVEKAVVETVMCGGDTDTNACIVGALIGAVEGIESLPPEWALAVQSARASAGMRERPAKYWPDDAVWLSQRLLG